MIPPAPEGFPSISQFLQSAGVGVPTLLEAIDYYLMQLRNRVAANNQMDDPLTYIGEHDYLSAVEAFRDVLATTGPDAGSFGSVGLRHERAGATTADHAGQGEPSPTGALPGPRP